MSRPPHLPPAAADPASAEFAEDSARRLCLLRACESGPPDDALWSPEDAVWASRLANESQVGAASPAAWLAERARHAALRLLPRRASLARTFERCRWSLRWVSRAAVAGLALGALADMVGHSQHINLLAAPVWAVIGWNLLVYTWITWQGLRAPTPARAAGPLRRAVQRAFGAFGALGAPGTGAERDAASTPERRFVALWARASAPLAESRAALLLHVASAALALGLVAGLYARALVLDYRVSWQSTLLEPAQAHAWLAAALAPASALTGIAVPGVDAVAALRIGAAGAPVEAAPTAAAAAAPWLHLLAATLAGAVIVPRLLLAVRAAWVAHRRARRVILPLADAATQKLLQARRVRGAAGVQGVQVLPHGFSPSPASTLALQALLAAHWGPGLSLHIAAAAAYGDEDRAPPTPPAGSAWRIVWFDLAATPEPQAQGRFVSQLLAASPLPLVVLVDEAAYRQRLGAASPRLRQRRETWQSLADEAGVGLACIDLAAAAASDVAAAAAALDAALQAHPAAVR